MAETNLAIEMSRQNATKEQETSKLNQATHIRMQEDKNREAEAEERQQEVQRRINTAEATTASKKHEMDKEVVKAEMELALAQERKEKEVALAQASAQAESDRVRAEGKRDAARFAAEGLVHAYCAFLPCRCFLSCFVLILIRRPCKSVSFYYAHLNASEIAATKEKNQAQLDFLREQAALLADNPGLVELLKIQNDLLKAQAMAQAAATNPNVVLLTGQASLAP